MPMPTRASLPHQDEFSEAIGLHARRVQVTFTEDQWALMATLRGVMGDSDATVVRNIVIAWLAEKSLLTTVVKERLTRWGLEEELKRRRQEPEVQPRTLRAAQRPHDLPEENPGAVP